VTDSFPSLAHREAVAHKYGLGDGFGGPCIPYKAWDPRDLAHWFAYHYGWFRFFQGSWQPSCPLDRRGRHYNRNLAEQTWHMYCLNYCSNCRKWWPCQAHGEPVDRLPPTPQQLARVRTLLAPLGGPPQTTELPPDERWDQRNRRVLDAIGTPPQTMAENKARDDKSTT